MPRSQWVRINATENAAQKLNKKVNSGDDFQLEVGITNQVEDEKLALVVSSIKHINNNGDIISNPAKMEKLEQIVPSYISGEVSYNNKTEEASNIPVLLKEKTIKNQMAYFNEEYRPVPGGCETRGGCTLGTPAQDDLSSGDPVWITAGHCANHEENTPFYQPDTQNKIGESRRVLSKDEGDVAIIGSGSADVSWDIAAPTDEPNKYDWPIEGIVSHDAIKVKIDNGEATHFQGRTTGRDSTASVMDLSKSPDYATVVEISHKSDGGDSGGLYFDVIAGGAYILGIHYAEGDYEWWARGTTMEWIENNMNVTV